MTVSEDSLRARIKNLAQAQDRSVNQVLKQLYLERFLARLSRSAYADQFIFKGGNLLSYFIDLGRETKDLDFLITKLSSEKNMLEAAFKTIAAIETTDGFSFSYVSMKRLEQSHMQYPGFRATLEIRFVAGTLKDNIQIDLGFGDIVKPKTQDINLLQYKNKPFFETSLSLLVYPTETIFAEKLETVISKGGLNSRMKDYHDLVLIGRQDGLIDTIRMASDIKVTFKNRCTAYELPINFNDADYERLHIHWLRHLRGLGDLAQELKLPTHIKQVVLEVNDFLRRSGIIEKL
jgi:predicted nucleotidyltransferase component of viral defense system